MNRPPWAPLNAGVFLIILGGVFLVSFFNVGILNLATAFPMIFALFGLWLVIEGFAIPPENQYSPPRTMVVGWGALIAGLGILWFVGWTAGSLLPLVFVVLVIVAGIAAVGYSFMRASPKSSTTSAS